MKNRKEIVARFRLEALLQMERTVGKKNFDDIGIGHLCEKMHVTRVTFYNVYFPKKIDLLDYWFQIWCLRQTAELFHSRKEGLKGIEFLSDKLWELFVLHPGIVRGWVYYSNQFSKTKNRVMASTEEKKLLFPNIQAKELPILSFHGMMENYVSEAIDRNQISTTMSASQTASCLTAQLLGLFMTSQSNDINEIRGLCEGILQFKRSSIIST